MSNTSLPPSFIHSTNNPCLLSLCDPMDHSLPGSSIHGVRGVWNFLGFVLSQQKFEATSGPMLQPLIISRTDQCYSSVLFLKQRKIHPQGVRAGRPKRHKEKPPAQFSLLFLYVFSPPPGPALCKLGQPGVLFVLPEVLTLVLRSFFVLFSQAFPFLVF